jgi:predicted aspartyl protease
VVDRKAPSDADQALIDGKYADAERLYNVALAADPASGKAMAGLVRTALRNGKIPEALTLAQKYSSAHPDDPDVIDALGEVRFRRGEVDEAKLAFNKSIILGPCNGRTHFDVAQFLNLAGMYATSQKRIETAHALSPHDPEITKRWMDTHATPMTPEEELAYLKEKLSNPAALKEEQKQGIEAAIKGIETRQKGSCELVTPMTETRLPIVPIGEGAAFGQENVFAAGLDVYFNGKRKRLEIDTGASGLLLSRSVAKAAGLVPELEVKEGGIGDQGLANAFVTHVDDIKIGNMEFKNCMVQVLEHGSVLDTDGLIGPDVFRDFVVTLDIPGREVRLAQLPKRPDEPSPKDVTLKTTDEASPISVADRAKDRYVPLEMKDWTAVYRSGHFLIFPTLIGKAPVKLFIMDTGASRTSITPEAAREVTGVGSDTFSQVRGISGEVQNLMVADSVSITFAGVRQVTKGMTSFHWDAMAQSGGVQLSGLIGFQVLRELVISIDYRDNLVHVVYDPSKGFHMR